MGREVRRVPAWWDHPTDAQGHLIPLYGASYTARVADWEEGARQWARGLRRQARYDGQPPDWVPKAPHHTQSYAAWAGARPDPKDSMPEWPEEARTHWQMYETTTEGTPLSPVMPSPEALARWLDDHQASACGSLTATYAHWLAMITQGGALAMVVDGGRLHSGVAWSAAASGKANGEWRK